ncbi:MAG: c-type cytochrome [Vicinamibacterales bacterium]
MAEKKGVGHAFNIDFLNVVFAASSLFLFLSVIWMVWDDFDRDWKNTQRAFAQLEYEVAQRQAAEATGKIDKAKHAASLAGIEAGRQKVEANRDKVDEIQKQIDDLDARLYRENQEYQFAKATYDQDRYTFEVAREHGDSSAERMGEAVFALRDQMNELNLTVEKTTAERAALVKQLETYTGELGEAQKQLDGLEGEARRLMTRVDVLAPSALKDYFRNAPLLDFMAPTIKVNQIITPNIVDDVNFTRVPKMDRCTTCHLLIDRPGYEKYPQPYTTHPNLEQYLGSASPHPMDQVGCSVCHEGQGQSVTFNGVHHSPATAEQRAEWEEKYHWHEPHEWDYPMLPKGMTEASCAKCHKQEIYVPGAENLNVAYATYERAGCYACHKTKGFEGLRRPGPTLTKINAKLSPDWVKTWIRNPKAVKPTTWMPRVWYNSNSNSPEDAVRNEVEIDAAVAYLFANTEPYELEVKGPRTGNAQSGEEIVKTIGCLGCHVLTENDRGEAGPHRTFGQPLQNIGNKTSYEWIYNWVRNPKHYSPDTYMPDLRLTDAQVADVATFLSGLKQSGGDAAKATPNQQNVDEVLLDYLRNVMPFEEAKATLAKMDPQTKQVELGQRVINRYGCYSCHLIKGFENTQPIGTDLSEEGTKLVSRLDFALIEDIPHTSKIEWFNAKLHDPRIFDKGRVLNPLEKLRMPNFEFSDVEVQRLITAIMSFQREIQPPQAMPVKTARRDFVVQGRALVSRRNCVGCHVIEGNGGDYLKLVSEPTLGPPLLTGEGAKVNHDWLYAFLRGPITIRPWLQVRMPTFGLDDQNLNGIISYFGAQANEMGSFRTPQIVHTAASTTAGKEMFDLLKCQQCHVLGAIPKDQPTSNLAPDLRMAPERLQADWIVDWLKNPAALMPGTRMPGFFPDYPKSFYPQLGGDAQAQIEAIRNHLMTFKGGPSPMVGTRTAN